MDGLALTVLGTLSVAALQFLPRASPQEVASLFARWAELIRRLMVAPSGEEAMAALSEYALTTSHASPEVLIEVVARTVDRGASQIMKTAAMELIRRGRVEGRLEGQVEGRLEGQVELITGQLEKRFGRLPVALKSRIAAAAPAELERWGLRLLDAATLDQVFGDESLPQ